MKRQYSPEEELLALKLAYHGVGMRAEKTGFYKNKTVRVMRIAYRRGEEIQKELKTHGEEIKRRAVLALEKKPELCLEVEGRFSGKEQINDADILWLLKLARKERIV